MKLGKQQEKGSAPCTQWYIVPDKWRPTGGTRYFESRAALCKKFATPFTCNQPLYATAAFHRAALELSSAIAGYLPHVIIIIIIIILLSSLLFYYHHNYFIVIVNIINTVAIYYHHYHHYQYYH
jgi:general stress protein CsbA